MLCGCRAFGFGRRRGRFDLLPVPARGFTPAGPRQGQLELVWRSRFGHETPDLLALSFNPFSVNVRALGQARRTTMPSSDLCTTVRPPYDVLSPEGHGADLSE